MKVLLCHNYYQQPGGEDRVFSDEAWLLESHGHEVIRYTRHNDDISRMNNWEIARRTIWNHQTYANLRKLIRQKQPDIMHCTNTFPLISPAAYYAAQAEGVPVVQSLQNYRLLCPGSYFLRDGRVCQDCIGKSVPWPAVLHSCYRNDRAASAVVTTMISLHRAMRTWNQVVTLYVVLTKFALNKFLQAGFLEDQLAVKPNGVFPSPGAGSGGGGYALFVGRLSSEKGIATLITTWNHLNGQIPLKIVGDGPLSEKVQKFADNNSNVEWVGHQSKSEVERIVGEASFLIVPSIWYEGLPKTVVEAYSKGTPVIASNIGSLKEIVEDGRTGLHFEPGNADDLAAKVKQLINNPDQLAQMRQKAYEEYEAVYTAEPNYRALMTIYQRAKDRRTLSKGRSNMKDKETENFSIEQK